MNKNECNLALVNSIFVDKLVGNETTVKRDAGDNRPSAGSRADYGWEFFHECTTAVHGQVEGGKRWK